MGEININGINISSTVGGTPYISVSMITASNDIIALRDLYLTIADSDITVTTILDDISSSSRTSGVGQTPVSSLMFNSLQVSNSIEQQVPDYLSNEYPNFINFFKDYYRFLETNGNALDLLNGLTELVDIDTYTEADAQATLDGAITASDTSITVLGHVDFPLNNGLLKIDSEVIFYKRLEHTTDNKTNFNECSRGWTYNTLTVTDGFTPNNVTVAADHADASIVNNQSYNYILYFLEQIREQYLIDFPSNTLVDNLDLVNVDFLLKRAKDFYLSKGTPQGIDYYFKFLFQEKPELKNYNESLIDASNATYQSKEIVRIESLDNYDPRSLDGDSFMQEGNEFPIQTVENVFSSSSQVYEVELSNGALLNPTRFTKITSTLIEDKLFVDSTYEFPEKGYLRIGEILVEYTEKLLIILKLRTLILQDMRLVKQFTILHLWQL